MSHIGPTLPPHLQKKLEDDKDSSSDDADLYGPALPAHLKQLLKMPSNGSAESDFSKGRKPLPIDDEIESTSGDDRVFGPLPANLGNTVHNSSFDVEHRSLKMKRKLLGVDDDEANKQPKREDWMIELPELKRKNFGPGPRAFNRSEKLEVVGRDQWTSNPTSQVNFFT